MNRIAGTTSRSAALTDPRLRALLLQAFLVVVLVLCIWWVVDNTRSNLAVRQIASGIGFFDVTAGFAIAQSLVPYEESSTYGRAFVVGLLNTLLVSGLGIVLATIIGFAVGIARLSSNVLLARVAGAYVETLRNLPLLFQILFWYLAVLGTLPGPRESSALPGSIFFTNRGVMMPRPVFEPGVGVVITALLLGVVLALAVIAWARRRQALTGRAAPGGWIALALILGLPGIAFFFTGLPVRFDLPRLEGFNFVGGMRVIPEFLALLFALSTYTGAFIAEIVRAGILSVPRGQTEAAFSLGLRPRPALRLVIVPQAMRLIVPPLTSQYLNLIKNSSLAAAIGYPDFFYVFAGTTLNQTGQAVEIIAITMAVYLAISLVTSLAMNGYNRALARRGMA